MCLFTFQRKCVLGNRESAFPLTGCGNRMHTDGFVAKTKTKQKIEGMERYIKK